MANIKRIFIAIFIFIMVALPITAYSIDGSKIQLSSGSAMYFASTTLLEIITIDLKEMKPKKIFCK